MAPYPDDQEKYDLPTTTSSSESIQTSTGSAHENQYDLTHMDSAGEYSIGSSQASMQMAQYLDDVESSGATNDIHSFQDVNLNEKSSAVFGNNNGDDDNEEEEIVRRARKRYYLLPMLIKYSLPIGGCFLGFIVLLVTIGVTASVVRSQDEKRFGVPLPEISGAGMGGGSEEVGEWHEYSPQGGEEEVGDFGVDLYDDAPVYDDATSLDDFGVEASLDDFSGEKEMVFDDATSLDDFTTDDGDEEVGSPLQFESSTTTDDEEQSFMDEDGDEEVGTPIEFTSSTDDGEVIDRTELLNDAIDKTDSLDDAIDTSTSSNTHSDSSSSTHPKWYTTSHPSYVSLLEFHTSTSANLSPHHTAALFCDGLGEMLCSYSTYCPSGHFGDPYNGGPDGLFNMAKEEWEQWAPVNTHGQGVGWVQVGKILDADGEYTGRCQTYDSWSGGEGVEATVAPEHRRYILCCDSQNV